MNAPRNIAEKEIMAWRISQAQKEMLINYFLFMEASKEKMFFIFFLLGMGFLFFLKKKKSHA